MDNTGYKVATKIKVAKKSGDSISEKTYPIGRYNGDNFVSYSSHELAQLSPEEYKKCVQDTKLYILTEEEMENMGDFLNENMVQDFGMCPLPLPVDMISASGEVDSNNYIWVTFTSQYEVASDILIKMMYEDSIVPNEILLLKGHKTVTAQQHPNRGGTEAMLDLNVKGSLLKEDSTYRYSIQPTILIPKLNIIDDKFNPVTHVFGDKVQLTYVYSFAIQISDVVIRVSINENGVESYFDIVKKAYDGTENMYDVPANFLGKTANVRIYSVNGVVGETSDSRYKYLVENTIAIPNILPSNKLSASVYVPNEINPEWPSDPAYAPLLTIKSENPVTSDLEFEIGNVNASGRVLVPYPVMKSGTSVLEKTLPYSTKGRTIDILLYSIGGVPYKGYDEKYRYSLDVQIEVPKS